MDKTEKTIELNMALEEYNDIFMISRNFTTRTRINYSQDISDLIKFLKNSYKITDVKKVERDHIQKYFALLVKKVLKGVTRRRKAHSIKSFLDI